MTEEFKAQWYQALGFESDKIDITNPENFDPNRVDLEAAISIHDSFGHEFRRPTEEGFFPWSALKYAVSHSLTGFENQYEFNYATAEKMVQTFKTKGGRYSFPNIGEAATFTMCVTAGIAPRYFADPLEKSYHRNPIPIIERLSEKYGRNFTLQAINERLAQG